MTRKIIKTMKNGKIELNWLQKLIIMLLYADDKKPIEGRSRLKAMLFITIQAWPFLKKSSTIRKFMKEVRF